MNSLSIAGIGRAGGSIAVFLLAIIVLLQMGQDGFASIATLGLLIFVGGGAIALVARALK